MLKTIIFTFFCSISYAQNLVENYSFEEISQCPYVLGDFDFVDSWYNSKPTISSPDLFSTCAISSISSIPSNSLGFQQPYEGSNYVGLAYRVNGTLNNLYYSEYISTQLHRPLNKGEVVRVSFQISLANNTNFGSKVFGFILSESPYVFNSNTNNYTLKEVISSSFIDTVVWVEFEAYYTSYGCEEYLTIGVFNNKINSNNIVPISAQPGSEVIYFYIDNVVIEPISSPNNDFKQANIITANNDNINDVWYPNVDCINNWECTILNRWGEAVYSFSDSNGWDGKDKNGRILNEGVYFYILSNKDTNEKITGEITVVR